MSIDPTVVRRRCADLGGIVRTHELTAAGIDQYSIKKAVRVGALVRVRDGLYVDPDLPADISSAVAHGGALGCVNRARAAGLWVLDRDDGDVHVAMPRNGRRQSHGSCTCLQHWSGATAHRGMTSLVDALAQMLGCVGVESFFVSLESAMRKRLIDRAQLTMLRAQVPADRRWLIDFARWNADSGLESLLRLRLRKHGISLVSQVSIPGVGRVDFLVGDRLILEVDGKPGHADAASRHKDLVRDAVAATFGLSTLRFDYSLVVHDWPLVEAAVLAKVANLHAPVR